MPPVLGPPAWADPWFIINRCLDVIFFFDMIAQFFIAYLTGNPFAGPVWVEDHRKIVLRYLTSWFALDATTVFLPGAFDLYLASGSMGGEEDAGAAGQMGMLRVLRALRLIKLVRLIRASRVFDRWKAKITLSYGSQASLLSALLDLNRRTLHHARPIPAPLLPPLRPLFAAPFPMLRWSCSASW